MYSIVKVKNENLSVMSNSLRPHGLYSPWNSPGQNTGVGSHSLLQGIFPGVKPRSPALQMDSLQAEPQGKFRWVAYPFSRRSARHRNKIGVSCVAGRVFTN